MSRDGSLYFFDIKRFQFGTFATVGRIGSSLIAVIRGSPCSLRLDCPALLRGPQEAPTDLQRQERAGFALWWGHSF